MINKNTLPQLEQLTQLARIAQVDWDFDTPYIPPHGVIAKFQTNKHLPPSLLTLMSKPSPNTIAAAEQGAETSSPINWLFDHVKHTDVYLGGYHALLQHLSFWAVYESEKSQHSFHIIDETLPKPFSHEAKLSTTDRLITQLSVATILELTNIDYLEVEPLQIAKSAHFHKSGHVSQPHHL